MKQDINMLFEQFKADFESDKTFKTVSEKKLALDGEYAMINWMDATPQKDTIIKVLKLADDAKKEWLLFVENFGNFDEDFEPYRIKYIIKHWNDESEN